jgi:integrase
MRDDLSHPNGQRKKTLDKIPILSNDSVGRTGRATEDQGLQAMRDGRVRDEMPNVRRKYLSPDEARRVIEAAGKTGCQADRDRLLLTMMFRHGLRLSEAIDLRWSDFDLESRHHTLFVRRLKGSKDAVHSLEPDTVRLLKRAKAQSDGNYVFRSERGGPLSPQIVQVIVARAGKIAGLPFRVHPHHLRHACGFALAEEGIDTRLIQDYLGHRSIANTVIYTETSARRLASVRVR